MTHSRIVRRRAQPASDNGEQLLRELVEAEPTSDTFNLRPVALRSTALQRRQALRGYALRNQVDVLLVYAERLAALALIFVVGFVAAREPIGAWLYGSGTVPVVMPRAKEVAAAELPPRPKLRPGSLALDSLGSGVKASAVEVARRPGYPRADKALTPECQPEIHSLEPCLTAAPSPTRQSPTAKAVTARAPHPELGHTLPSSPLASVPFGAEPEAPVVARRPVFSAVSKPPTGEIVAVPKPPIAPAIPPSWLEIPTINMDTPVVEVFLQDNVWQVADDAAGYHHGTGLPGAGNVVMAGHKGVRGAVFARLEALTPGHDIFVTAADTRYHYRVRETRRVWPSEVEVMYPTPSPTLTLLTCTNWDLQRFVVVADLVESVPLAEEQASSSTK